MTGVLVAAVIIGVPALAFAVWPLIRRGRGRSFLAFPPDAREQLTEQKRGVLRALRELDFEHAAGHVSDDDFADLRARYEAEAAEILGALDGLGAAVPEDRPPVHEAAGSPRRSAWLHPAVLAASAVFLVVFGGTLGVGLVRYTAPDESASMGAGGEPPGTASAPGGMGTAPDGPVASGPMARGSGGGGSASRPLPPAMLQGMLNAARESLITGRYGDAFSAYRAILTRDPNSADALSHIGVLAAIADHPGEAIELLDRARAIDPDAINAWEHYVQAAPAGEDRERVKKLLADAKSRDGASRKR
ncbi:MAG: hypothetical protein HYU51_15695 [Candidatus Rokubacteria bacterium]|nr:hypothetical protein [Candidatus Rokubacteria bacterium]